MGFGVKECTQKTKGAFEGANGAIQTHGSLGSLKSSLSFVCGSHNGSTWSYRLLIFALCIANIL